MHKLNNSHMLNYGTPKLSYVVIFLVVLSKNCVNLSMHYVIILKTRVVLSIYNVDMPIRCLIMLKNHFILSQRGVILSKRALELVYIVCYYLTQIRYFVNIWR